MDLNELKKLVLELSHRVTVLEDRIEGFDTVSKTVSTSVSKSIPITSSTSDYSGRPIERLYKMIVLSRDEENCLCGLQISKKDKQIPMIKLNLFNLQHLIEKMEEALRVGEKQIVLGDYKQSEQFASFIKGEWKMQR